MAMLMCGNATCIATCYNDSTKKLLIASNSNDLGKVGNDILGVFVSISQYASDHRKEIDDKVKESQGNTESIKLHFNQDKNISSDLQKLTEYARQSALGYNKRQAGNKGMESVSSQNVELSSKTKNISLDVESWGQIKEEYQELQNMDWTVQPQDKKKRKAMKQSLAVVLDNLQKVGVLHNNTYTTLMNNMNGVKVGQGTFDTVKTAYNVVAEAMKSCDKSMSTLQSQKQKIQSDTIENKTQEDEITQPYAERAMKVAYSLLLEQDNSCIGKIRRTLSKGLTDEKGKEGAQILYVQPTQGQTEHAEMKILAEISKNPHGDFYIGLSKPCCLDYAQAIQAFNSAIQELGSKCIVITRGEHNNQYTERWAVPDVGERITGTKAWQNFTTKVNERKKLNGFPLNSNPESFYNSSSNSDNRISNIMTSKGPQQQNQLSEYEKHPKPQEEAKQEKSDYSKLVETLDQIRLQQIQVVSGENNNKLGQLKGPPGQKKTQQLNKSQQQNK